MAKETAITTGEQSVTTAGAITGTLSTATLTGAYCVKVRVRGLLPNQKVTVALEDTVNAFSNSIAVKVWDFVGVGVPEGVTDHVMTYDVPSARFGISGSAFRANCYRIDSSTTALVSMWLEQ